MKHDDLINSLMKLNNARRGSLGEYIFWKECLKQGVGVKSFHEQRIDFIINETSNVDVKASFSKHKSFLNDNPIGTYSGKRYSGIQYALVQLFSDGMRISIDRVLFSEITLDQVKSYWEAWDNDKTDYNPKQHHKNNRYAFSLIRNEIVTYFKTEFALNARVIYRTVQSGFGKESPDNLAPKSISSQNITVFIDFRDQRISLDNINRIIAFPDERSKKFLTIKKPSLHLEKIDIDALDQIYKFTDVEDLLINFPKRFLCKI